MTYETILVETPAPGVGLVRLNRPQALNALNSQLTAELFTALEAFDQDADIKCMILTGSDKAFAAGADIKQMENTDAVTMFAGQDFTDWTRLTRLRKPLIGAVSGWALGGGCEMAMMCDMIFASEAAMFGQPEIKLGVLPGMGGSQRLTKLVGKGKAMDMILTGRMMDATEAERCGLVARVVPADKLMEETLSAAETIAGYGKTATMAAREAVDRALEGSLREGILYERRLFHALFSTSDQKEGMAAFIEKRPPQFRGK